MSDRYGLTGKVLLIGEEQGYGASDFRKRQVLVQTDEKYPQDIQFDFVQDNCSKLDCISEGDTVTVCFNIRSNENNGRYYTSLVGWKIDVEEAGTGEPEQVDDAEPIDESDPPPF